MYQLFGVWRILHSNRIHVKFSMIALRSLSERARKIVEKKVLFCLGRKGKQKRKHMRKFYSMMCEKFMLFEPTHDNCTRSPNSGHLKRYRNLSPSGRKWSEPLHNPGHDIYSLLGRKSWILCRWKVSVHDILEMSL